MKLSLSKLKKFGFNRRALSENDFFDICERENITVLEMDISTSFFLKVEDKKIIVLSQRLKGLKKIFVMFHELAYYFLHGGRALEAAFYFGLLDNKNEFEADALALVALIPKASLRSAEFLEENPSRYARKLFKERQRLFFLYGV